MTEYIVDTNVPLVASGQAEQMSIYCKQRCESFIERFLSRESGYVLVIDTVGEIINEYGNNIRTLGQPTIGSRFLKWVYTNQGNPAKVKSVDIHQHSEHGFEEVPPEIIQVKFDRADLKFIAVAIANERTAPIVQAADSRWIGWQEALVASGITVEYLCYTELLEIANRRAR